MKEETRQRLGIIAVMADMNVFPECFDSLKQFREWTEMAEIYAPEKALAWCDDCTPEYQAEMMLQDRCRRPEIRFIPHPNGKVYIPVVPC